jgi:hypothetical protein
LARIESESIVRNRYSGELAIALTLALGIAAFVAAPAGAQNGDTFTCRASVLRLTVLPPPSNPFEPYDANERNAPCRADEEGVQGRRTARSGIVTNGFTSAVTEVRRAVAGKNAVGAHSEVADIALRNQGIDNLRVEGATSRATVHCTADGALALTGRSRVGQVKLGDLKVSLGSKPQTLKLGPVTIYANRVIKTGNELTIRALEVVLGDIDVVIAESRAGFTSASSCG